MGMLMACCCLAWNAGTLTAQGACWMSNCEGAMDERASIGVSGIMGGLATPHAPALNMLQACVITGD